VNTSTHHSLVDLCCPDVTMLVAQGCKSYQCSTVSRQHSICTNPPSETIWNDTGLYFSPTRTELLGEQSQFEGGVRLRKRRRNAPICCSRPQIAHQPISARSDAPLFTRCSFGEHMRSVGNPQNNSPLKRKRRNIT